jgi:hypothetical protein
MWAVPRNLVCIGLLAAACLPADPPGFRRDAGRSGGHATSAKVLKAAPKRSESALTATGTASADAPPTEDAAYRLIDEALNEDFNRTELGPEWKPTSNVWHIQEGRLCGKGARNHPVWFNRRLPKNARIEFDATSGSPEGDLKAEAWGDGHSVPAGTTYDDATSYIVVLGGWKNRLNVLARLNEHAANRLELRLVPGSEDPRAQPIVEGRSYHVEIERADGKTVRVTVDDQLFHELEDPAPLVGHDHEHFAFNDWDVPVCFDDLLVTPLGD